MAVRCASGLSVSGLLQKSVKPTGNKRPSFCPPRMPVRRTCNVGFWQELPLDMSHANGRKVPRPSGSRRPKPVVRMRNYERPLLTEAADWTP